MWPADFADLDEDYRIFTNCAAVSVKKALL